MQPAFEFFIDVLPDGTSVCQGVQPRVVPLEHGFLRTVQQVGYVYLNFLHLADTVQSPDTLFEQVWVKRQVEQDQVMSELKVPPLAADLGAQQKTGSGGVGKEMCRPVAGDDTHAFMKNGGVNAMTAA